MNRGPRHKSYPPIDSETDSPYSYGPSIGMLVRKVKATKASRQDGETRPGFYMAKEPQAEKELNFN